MSIINLEKENEDLRKKLEGLTVISKLLRTQLEDSKVSSQESKSAFLANMSHELRTPLNSILGFSNLLSDSSLDIKQKEYLDIILSSGTSLLEIINDILDLSKFESGKIKFEFVDFCLKDFIDEVMNMMMVNIKDKKIETFIKLDPSIPVFLKGDAHRLKQVLVNLLSNAIKFTDQGEVGIEVFREDQKTATDGFLLYFKVFDSGVGIPEDKLEVIFDLFSQVDISTTRKFGGTGLGLAICKAIVESMQGKIWVQSQEGRGSTFIFTSIFQGGGKDQGVRLDFHEKQEIDFSEIKILVVEDSDANQMLMKAYFDKMGCQTEYVSNGKEAIEKVRFNQYDLCFMDLQMAGMDGITATKIIRQEITKQLPIVALTASVLEENRIASKEAGMVDYLNKPVDMVQLREKIVLYGKKKEKI